MRLIKLKAMKRVNTLHYTPDGRKLLAVGGAEVRMQDWAVWVDVGEMTETLRIPMFAGCAAVSADCARIAIGDGNGSLGLDTKKDIPPVVVIDATDPNWHEDESRRQTVVSNSDNIYEMLGLAFNPTGTRLATTVSGIRGRLSNSSCVLYPLQSGKPVIVQPEDTNDDALAYNVVAFSPDGKRLAATGGLDGEPGVVIVDARTADRVKEFAPPGTQTRHLVYSPDSGTLAVVNGKGVFLHPSESVTPHFTLAHPKQTNAVAFTPNGRRILSTCHDGLLRIWDTATGQLVTSYDWGIGQTTAVVVSPDGLTAAVAGQKGQIAVFDVD